MQVILTGFAAYKQGLLLEILLKFSNVLLSAKQCVSQE